MKHIIVNTQWHHHLTSIAALIVNIQTPIANLVSQVSHATLRNIIMTWQTNKFQVIGLKMKSTIVNKLLAYAW